MLFFLKQYFQDKADVSVLFSLDQVAPNTPFSFPRRYQFILIRIRLVFILVLILIIWIWISQ